MLSCSPVNYQVYYQMYQTKPSSENIKVYENKIVYEDDKCSIMYDFWSEYGNAGFIIYNKSLENLVLHLDKSFYINNGIAYDYFKNRIYNSKSSVNEVYTIESKTICVPPKCIKEIKEYVINNSLYQNCSINYRGYISSNNTVSFNKYDSPYVFSNVLVYSIGDSEEIHSIKNEFYVSKITNCSSEDVMKSINSVICDTKETEWIQVFKESGPDKFYIQYH